MFQKWKLLLGLCSTLSTSYAGIVEHYLHKIQEEKTPLIAAKTIRLSYFQQLIDHNDSLLGTFSQRYYVDETYGPSMILQFFSIFAVSPLVQNAP